MSENYGFVYIWRDRKHKRYYIGAHWGTECDYYICSSSWMKSAYKRRPQDFKRKIIFKTLDRQQMYDTEYAYLSLIKDYELGKKYYNLSKFHYKTGPHHGKKLSEEHKRKIRENSNPWHKGKNLPEKIKKKMSEIKIGKPSNVKGKKFSDKTKIKMSLAKLKMSDITKEKISNAKLGKPSPKKGKKYPKEGKIND